VEHPADRPPRAVGERRFASQRSVPQPGAGSRVRAGQAVRCSAELGYARVSTAKQDLDRQVDALTAAGIPAKRIYLDKNSGATTDRRPKSSAA